MTTSHKKFGDRTGIVLAILEDRTQYRTRIFEFVASITAVVFASVKPPVTRSALIAEALKLRELLEMLRANTYSFMWSMHVLLFTRQKRMGEQAYVY